MTRKLADQMEWVIERALAPGEFISQKASYDFISDLEAAQKQVARLLSTDPKIAVTLYETFLAGCNEKAEEIDDSYGSFGQFAGELFCGWIKARQAAGCDPDETVARLLAWMDNDPYAFCFRLENSATKVFNKAGLVAFEKAARARYEAAVAQTSSPNEPSRRSPDCERRQFAAILRAVYLKQKDINAYVALSEATGLTAKDCHAVATMLLSRRKRADAFSWVNRGLAFAQKDPGSSVYDLAQLKRELLVKLGRGSEALDAAWAGFQEHPSKYSYEELMKYVPQSERTAWHEKAMAAAKGTDLHSIFELLIETKEIQRLADLVAKSKDCELEDMSHYATESAAKALEKSHLAAAARLWCAQGMRVVKAKKSKYYDAAIANFERARCCYEKAGLVEQWQCVVTTVRSEHYRKTGFITGFERIAAGLGPEKTPSFLERAKVRWGFQKKEDGQ